MARTLTLGYSTCPNDTFMFFGLAHGRIDCDLDWRIHLADVETLNQDAGAGRWDVSKVSFAALGNLQETYGLLRSGAALGRGCGPLIVARPGFEPDRLPLVDIAVPGLQTTANLLLGLYLTEPPRAVPMTFDRIMPAVSRGEFEAGVIIHEGRFTYSEYGLESLVDLGRWWEDETGLPIPLGGIAVRRDLGADIARRAEAAVRDSVRFALDHPDAAADYIRSHAREMAPAVIQRHIDLYVNDFSMDLGREGEAAVAALFDRGRRCGVLPPGNRPLFAYFR